MLARAVSVALVMFAGACGGRATDPPAGPPMTEADRIAYRRNVVVTVVKITPLPRVPGKPPSINVVADLVNRGDRELGVVHVVFSFHGKNDREVQEEPWFPVLVGGGFVPAQKPLAPNETRRFDADLNVPPELLARVDVRVEAVHPVVVTGSIR